MCSKPTSLAVLMAKADKYATTDSAMRVMVTASDKSVPTPATPKPAGDGLGGQNNNKCKADQMDSRSNNKLVASVEGETLAPQAGPQWKRPKQNSQRLPQSLSNLGAPQDTLRARLTTPFDSAASHAGCRKGMAYRLPQVRRLRLIHRLLVLLRLHSRRLATTAASTITTTIKTEHLSSSPVKAMTSIACARDGMR
ncbi:hypothetical protein ZWY2020_022384 [Hordeum vulgare]|nr:hypothetical protein ZWY2020_022384 [Hordeum vulgare]